MFWSKRDRIKQLELDNAKFTKELEELKRDRDRRIDAALESAKLENKTPNTFKVVLRGKKDITIEAYAFGFYDLGIDFRDKDGHRVAHFPKVVSVQLIKE